MVKEGNSICNACVHVEYCVITHDKGAVYSCSEYDFSIQKSKK